MSDDARLDGVTEADVPAVTRTIVHAFATTAEGTQEWLRSMGHEHLRVLRAGDGPPPACLLRVPMGQYFGGRAVRMLGIAGVGVAPESRGKGYAKKMMAEAVREAARDGFALSVLYPSTQPLYRAAGYEQAGHRLLIRVPIAEFDAKERGLDVVALGENDWPAVKACYGVFGPRFDGMVERGPYVWGRVAKWHDQKFQGYGIRNNSGGLDGYAFVLQKKKESSRQEIMVQDLAFVSAAAGRRMLQFLGEFGTMGDDAVFLGGPSHPALIMLGRQKYKMEFGHYWMLRIVNVVGALGGRGYPSGVRADIEFEVRDEVVPENAGNWILRVEDGSGQVLRGGYGRIKTDIRGLAALYSGHLTPVALALAGMVEGEEKALREAGAVFGGGSPWMTDFF